jgi:hypothetical protein
VGPGEPKGSALIRLYQITVAERRFLFSRDFLHQDAVRLGLRLSNKRGRTSCVMGMGCFYPPAITPGKGKSRSYMILLYFTANKSWFPVAR